MNMIEQEKTKVEGNMYLEKKEKVKLNDLLLTLDKKIIINILLYAKKNLFSGMVENFSFNENVFNFEVYYIDIKSVYLERLKEVDMIFEIHVKEVSK
jgi:hypothetical protein